jgi:hypothetical protein
MTALHPWLPFNQVLLLLESGRPPCPVCEYLGRRSYALALSVDYVSGSFEAVVAAVERSGDTKEAD